MTTSSSIIRKLSAHLARHGIAEKLNTHNGPQFASEEFARFAASWGFKHITSSPGIHNPTLLRILEYRNTPVEGLASPAQLLMGRGQLSILSTTSSLLQPHTVSPQQVLVRRQQCHAKQAALRPFQQAATPLYSLERRSSCRQATVGSPRR